MLLIEVSPVRPLGDQILLNLRPWKIFVGCKFILDSACVGLRRECWPALVVAGGSQGYVRRLSRHNLVIVLFSTLERFVVDQELRAPDQDIHMD
jgi:hypothetical protein